MKPPEEKYGNEENIKFCKPDCEYLKPTEEEQDKLKIEGHLSIGHHMCLKYNKMVKHSYLLFDYHPRLPRLNECNEL